MMKINIKKSIVNSLSLAVGVVALSGQVALSQVYVGGSIGGGYLHGKRTDTLKLIGAGGATMASSNYNSKSMKELNPELNIFMGYLCNLINSNNYVSIEPFFNLARNKSKVSGTAFPNTPLQMTRNAKLERQHGLGILGKFGYKFNKVDSFYLVLGVQANKFKYSTWDSRSTITTSKMLPGVLVGFGFDKKLENNTKIGFDVRYNFYKKLTLNKRKNLVESRLVGRPKAVIAAVNYTFLF